ncbi:hypothetical protein BGY98DRAFT_981874 [Russula aff. rugulosa BPL654]|nr:hypothetical protein BGY98DRAFT_981874 [Russula aff. rugulosa BPL654]
MEFRTKIRQRHYIDSIKVWFLNHIPLKTPRLCFLWMIFLSLTAFLKWHPRASGNKIASPVNVSCTILQARFLSEGWKEGDFIKVENIRWIFDQLGWYFQSVLGSREKHAYGGDWPFKLIVSVEHPKNEYHYTPRSDFSVFIDKLACLLVEIQSDEDQSDRNRMLLQAACAARLGRQMYNNTFIVVALYIETSGRVIRYFIFQRDDADPTVRSSESKQSCVFSLILLGFL